MSVSSCPLSFLSDTVQLPGSLYNYSYYCLFPPPYCMKCGYGFNSKGQCTNLEPVSPMINNAALYTSGKCPTGHIDLPGLGCTNLTASYNGVSIRAPTGYNVVNGQLTQTGHKRPSGLPCGPCGGGDK